MSEPQVGDLVFMADGSSGPWEVKKIASDGALWLGFEWLEGAVGCVDPSRVAVIERVREEGE